MKPMLRVKVEVIVTGDEIMYGRIIDTNSHWLAGRIAELGAKLVRITTIGDDPKIISSTLFESLKRDVHFIIFTGGLGPSEDDLTVESIGKALGEKVVYDPITLDKIHSVYKKRGITDEASIIRGQGMSRILVNSEPLQNPVGFAVGMKLEVGSKVICTLPGVPEEMRGMFNMYIAPMIRSHTGNSVFYARSYIISMVWKDFFPLYRQMQSEYPNIYIKNAATPPVEGSDRNKVYPIKVDFVIEARTQGEAEKIMENFVMNYKKRIQLLGEGKMELLVKQ
jgi:nicotinamide-nucleotide amidase